MLVCPLCLSSFREIGVVEGFLRSVCVCVCVCEFLTHSTPVLLDDIRTFWQKKRSLALEVLSVH